MAEPKRLNPLERYLSLWVGLFMVIGVLTPATEPSSGKAHPAARQLLSADEACLPLVLVDEAVVSQGAYPSRAQIARDRPAA